MRLAILAMIFLPGIALAQDAAPAAEIDPLLALALQLAEKGGYLGLAVAALVVLVALLRMGLGRWLAGYVPALAFLATDRGGALLTAAVGLLTVVGGGLAAGAPLTVGLVVSGLVAAGAAAGLYVLPRKVVAPADGKLAAAEDKAAREASVTAFLTGEIRRTEAHPRTPEETRKVLRGLLKGAPRG